MKAVAATQRTVSAIRKADALPRNLLVKSNRRGVSTTPRSSKGGAYCGYFTVKKNNSTTVNVWDSFESDTFNDATNAGYVQVNNQQFILTKSNVTVSENGFIVVFADITSGSINTPVIKFLSDVSYVTGEMVVILARVKFSAGAITALNQEHYGAIYGGIFTETL